VLRLRYWCLVFLALAVSASKSPHQRNPIDWSKLPAELRPYVHLSVKDLPEYPEPDDSLMDAHRWPLERTFEGKHCRRKYRETQADVLGPELDSVYDAPKGWGYTVRYEVVPAEQESVRFRRPGESAWRSIAVYTARGPTYYWRPDGSLGRRDYNWKGRFRAWFHDRSGAVRMYIGEDAPMEGNPQFGGREWFGSSGDLQGFGLTLYKDGKATQHHYWDGSSVTDSVDSARQQDFWQEMRRDSRSRR